MSRASVQDRYQEATTEELGDYYSDFFKDCHGFRPRNIDFNDRNEILLGIARLEEYLEQMMSTETGRQQLRDDGWNI